MLCHLGDGCYFILGDVCYVIWEMGVMPFERWVLCHLGDVLYVIWEMGVMSF